MRPRALCIAVVGLLLTGAMSCFTGGSGKGTIQGHVYAAGTTDAISGASVKYALAGEPKYYTDAQGFYEVPDIPKGNQTIWAGAAGYDSNSIQVEVVEDQTTEADIELTPTT